MKKYLFWITLLVQCLAIEGFAQGYFSYKRDMKVIMSVGMGTSTYFGEMQNPSNYVDMKPSFNAGIQAFQFPNFIGNRLSTRSELTYFRLQGTDKTATNSRVVRNLSFYSDNLEVNSMVLLHLFPVSRRIAHRNFLNFYGALGGGLLYMNPKADYDGDKVALQPLATEGTKYSKFQIVIPFGFGIKLFRSSYYNVAIEGTWRKTFTDHLDDVSASGYPNPAKLPNDLARALSDRRGEYYASIGVPKTLSYHDGVRGNPETKDSYMLVNIKLEYYLHSTVDDMYKKLMIIKVLKRHRR